MDGSYPGWGLRPSLSPKGKRTKAISTKRRKRQRKRNSGLVPAFLAAEASLFDFPSISSRCLVMNPWILLERYFSLGPYQIRTKKHWILTYRRQFNFFEVGDVRKYLRNKSFVFFFFFFLRMNGNLSVWFESEVSGSNAKAKAPKAVGLGRNLNQPRKLTFNINI